MLLVAFFVGGGGGGVVQNLNFSFSTPYLFGLRVYKTSEKLVVLRRLLRVRRSQKLLLV